MGKTLKPNTLTNQLRYWSLHCGLTGLPSFCLALIYFNSTTSVVAMLTGIATFIICFSAITSSSLYRKLHSGIVGRSIRLGTRIRMIVSLAGLPFLLPLIGHDVDQGSIPSMFILFTADFWFGYAALIITAVVGQALGGNYNGIGSSNFEADFAFIYMTTVIEGLLISVSLVLIAFFTLIILNAKRKPQIHQESPIH
jgi:hypothetical protein